MAHTVPQSHKGAGKTRNSGRFWFNSEATITLFRKVSFGTIQGLLFLYILFTTELLKVSLSPASNLVVSNLLSITLELYIQAGTNPPLLSFFTLLFSHSSDTHSEFIFNTHPHIAFDTLCFSCSPVIELAYPTISTTLISPHMYFTQPYASGSPIMSSHNQTSVSSRASDASIDSLSLEHISLDDITQQSHSTLSARPKNLKKSMPPSGSVSRLTSTNSGSAFVLNPINMS